MRFPKRLPTRVVFTLILSFALSLFNIGHSQSPATEWRSYGQNAGGVRYSQLKQINRENVKNLKRAWVYHTGELDLGMATSAFRASFSCTPIVVDGVMYLITPSSRVIALDAETGKEIWKFDPQAGKTPREFNSNRGVAYWQGMNGNKAEKRIIFGTVDGRLIALDAATGKPCPDFGIMGSVDLRSGFDGRWKQDSSWGARVTSPPAIYKNIAIVGWGLPESPSAGPSGDVRAFNILTGKLEWVFHTVPLPGEKGHDTWAGDSWKDRSGVNVWSIMSVDEEHGLVFLPVASPTYDFYGADRKGMNLFSDSLVALNAATGKLAWYYQLIHHDIWDYDLPAQPTLIDLKQGGRTIPAVAQVTKTGFVFVFNRLTGKPIFPIEERPVPQSEVPGEETWPTQPFPVKPPALTRQSFQASEISNVTPEANAYCKQLYNNAINRGMFTPTALKPTVVFPGFHGGGNWSGGSFDPSTGYYFVNMNEDGTFGEMTKHPAGAPEPYTRAGRFEEYAWFRDKQNHPCQQPPWGTLSAVNLTTGEIVWKIPLGVVDELEARGVHNTGTQNLGGTIVTAGGLVFVGATTDQRFRAFDSATGKELWETMLEANAHATPMTFLGKSGKQFVVIPAGGGGFLRDLSLKLSDTVVAYALPD